MTWASGDTVVLREIWQGQLWAARPMTVVADEQEALALWCPKGTIRKVPAASPSRAGGEPPNRGERHADYLASGDWVFADSEWDVSTLWLLREGDWHSVWLSFLEDSCHWGWYINFQEPFRRTRQGIQTMDLALDIIAEPDRSSWRWKDRDEFELFEARELIAPDVADRVRQEAKLLVERIERDEWPFNSDWPAWRPNGSWRVPTLPETWMQI
jgi:predicted RNA-binding protein associated with RNAse of E/G family